MASYMSFGQFVEVGECKPNRSHYSDFNSLKDLKTSFEEKKN